MPAFQTVSSNKKNNKLVVIFGLLSPSQTSKLSLQMKCDKTLSCRRVCHVCSIGYVRVCTVVLYVCVFGLHCVSLRLLFFPGSAYVRNSSPCGKFNFKSIEDFSELRERHPSPSKLMHGPLLLDRNVCLPLFDMWPSFGYFSTVI